LVDTKNNSKIKIKLTKKENLQVEEIMLLFLRIVEHVLQHLKQQVID
jgi:hypothetical protein